MRAGATICLAYYPRRLLPHHSCDTADASSCRGLFGIFRSSIHTRDLCWAYFCCGRLPPVVLVLACNFYAPATHHLESGGELCPYWTDPSVAGRALQMGRLHFWLALYVVEGGIRGGGNLFRRVDTNVTRVLSAWARHVQFVLCERVLEAHLLPS